MPSLTTQLTSLPKSPGVYLFKNQQGSVLYVGKAKKLRSRVRSYFDFTPMKNNSAPRPSHDLDLAKQQLIPQIHSVTTIICDSEHEALILEANLIHQHQPPYNVILTDDKFYLFIKITKEKLPRVFPVRRIANDGAHYFGPYSSAPSVRNTLKLLRRLFPYRNAADSPRDKIFPHPLFSQDKNNTRYDIPDIEYSHNINNIIRFLKGDRHQVINTLRAGMRQAARTRAFERAAIFRDQLQSLERLDNNQKVFMPHPESFDTISIATNANHSAANIFSIRSGKLINKNTFLLKHHTDTPAPDILRQFILQYYSHAQDIPSLILIPQDLPDAKAITQWGLGFKSFGASPKLLVPRRGLKKKLILMGETNARQFLAEQQSAFFTDTRLLAATAELAQALGLSDHQLHRVETYDISHIQGQLATGSMIVFIDGRPAPDQYRKFRLKLTGRPNDYAMLQEVLTRRFHHLSQDKENKAKTWPSPDLIIIDGGRGQLSSALKSLDDLDITGLPIISLAKQKEEIFLPGRSEPVILPYNSDALYLIQRLRDEAHRFTISYHRLLRHHQSSRSLLDEIPGIGPKTKQQLLRHFGSLKNIRSSSPADLTQVVGPGKAKLIKEYL